MAFLSRCRLARSSGSSGLWSGSDLEGQGRHSGSPPSEPVTQRSERPGAPHLPPGLSPTTALLPHPGEGAPGRCADGNPVPSGPWYTTPSPAASLLKTSQPCPPFTCVRYRGLFKKKKKCKITDLRLGTKVPRLLRIRINKTRDKFVKGNK